jgi:hypothetical protein
MVWEDIAQGDQSQRGEDDRLFQEVDLVVAVNSSLQDSSFHQFMGARSWDCRIHRCVIFLNNTWRRNRYSLTIYASTLAFALIRKKGEMADRKTRLNSCLNEPAAAKRGLAD